MKLIKADDRYNLINDLNNYIVLRESAKPGGLDVDSLGFLGKFERYLAVGSLLKKSMIASRGNRVCLNDLALELISWFRDYLADNAHMINSMSYLVDSVKPETKFYMGDCVDLADQITKDFGLRAKSITINDETITIGEL